MSLHVTVFTLQAFSTKIVAPGLLIYTRNDVSLTYLAKRQLSLSFRHQLQCKMKPFVHGGGVRPSHSGTEKSIQCLRSVVLRRRHCTAEYSHTKAPSWKFGAPLHTSWSFRSAKRTPTWCTIATMETKILFYVIKCFGIKFTSYGRSARERVYEGIWGQYMPSCWAEEKNIFYQ